MNFCMLLALFVSCIIICIESTSSLSSIIIDTVGETATTTTTTADAVTKNLELARLASINAITRAAAVSDATLAFAELTDSAAALQMKWISGSLSPIQASLRLRAALTVLNTPQLEVETHKLPLSQNTATTTATTDIDIDIDTAPPWEAPPFLAFLRLPLFAITVIFIYVINDCLLFKKRRSSTSAAAASLTRGGGGGGGGGGIGIGAASSGDLMGAPHNHHQKSRGTNDDDEYDADAIVPGGMSDSDVDDDEGGMGGLITDARPLNRFSYNASAIEEPLSSEDDGDD